MSRLRVAQLHQSGATDGQVVTWDDTLMRWVAADPPGGGGGPVALDDLADVDTTTTPPSDGDSLVYDSASGLWVPQAVDGGVGGGSGPTSIDDLTTFNNAFGSPLGSATDYEFDGVSTSAPTGWSLLGSSPVYREQLGAGVISIPPGSSWNARAFARSLPSESTWTAYAKMTSYFNGSNFAWMGMMLRNSAGGKLTGPGRVWASGEKWLVTDLNSLTSFAANTTTTGLTPFLAVYNFWYFRLKKNSATSYDIGFSSDGITWQTWVSGWNPQTFLGAAPDQIAFVGNSENSQVVEAACHWWRVRA